MTVIRRLLNTALSATMYRKISVLILQCVLILIIGCAPNNTEDKGDLSYYFSEVHPQVQKYYKLYLDSSSIQEARQNAEKILDILLAHKRESLYPAYARLYIIESSSGNRDKAQIYYEKAKYWYIVHLERMKLSPEAIVKEIDAYTVEECRRKALEMEKSATDGRGPRYLSVKG